MLNDHEFAKRVREMTGAADNDAALAELEAIAKLAEDNKGGLPEGAELEQKHDNG